MGAFFFLSVEESAIFAQFFWKSPRKAAGCVRHPDTNRPFAGQ